MALKKRTKSTNSANVSGLQELSYFTNIQENVLDHKDVIPWDGLSYLTVLFSHQPPEPATPAQLLLS